MVRILAPTKWGTEVNIPDSNSGFDKFRRATVDFEVRKKIQSLGILLESRDGNREPIGKDEYVIYGSFGWRPNEYELVRAVVPDIDTPRTYKIDEFIAHPFFPVVIKRRHADGGRGKFLIETSEQWDKFYRFLLNEGKNSWNSYQYQEFLETPSDRYTSYRVVVSAKGTILAAFLIYSNERKNSPTFVESNLPVGRLGEPGTSSEDFLTTPGSPYFLRSKRIVSNVKMGGGAIPLGPQQNSKVVSIDEKKILAEHALDPSHPQLPAKMRDQAKKIGSTLGRRLGLFTGIDFMQDSKGRIYYLEINREPSLGANKETDVHAYRRMMNQVIDELTH